MMYIKLNALTVIAVSYTHLDVYKRQIVQYSTSSTISKVYKLNFVQSDVLDLKKNDIFDNCKT